MCVLALTSSDDQLSSAGPSAIAAVPPRRMTSGPNRTLLPSSLLVYSKYFASVVVVGPLDELALLKIRRVKKKIPAGKDPFQG